VPVATQTKAQTEAPPATKTSSRSLALVFRAGGETYMKLAPVMPKMRNDDEVFGREKGTAEPMPKTAKAKLAVDDYIQTSIAVVATEDVPAGHRTWLGKRVLVDSTCSAEVTGFAVVGRLSGSPGYAGDDEEWTAANVQRHGAPVLAAKLDGCASGVLARDAELPMHVVPHVIQNDALVATAKRTLVRSAVGRAAQTEWAAEHPDSRWTESEGLTWSHQVLVHPTLNTTFVWVQGTNSEGCGGAMINAFALYRVNADGTLTDTKTKIGDILTIEQIVDLDNDGNLEVIGKQWIGGRLVNDAHGAQLEILEEPFYGCPC